jgi:uncharacterized protein YcaQ
MPTVYPLRAVRALALEIQRLTAPARSAQTPSADSIFETVDAMGSLQIDTLQVVARSHYLVIWSRHGAYDTGILDRLAYHPKERKLFEGWQHAACFIPLQEWRYQLPLQRSVREGTSRWFSSWTSDKKHLQIAAQVHDRIRAEGALRVSDFERGDHRGGAWWDWRPAKTALEYLYVRGDLMVADRANFQRVYDLTERVLPAWVDTSEPTRVERDRFWLERAARALGASLIRNPQDYAWISHGIRRATLTDLIKERVLVEVKARLADGEVHTLIVHPQNLPLLEKAADGEIKPQRTTFLSPFDSLFWAQGRDEGFWGFRQRLEAYTPAPKRIYGYFSLAILHGDQLVGRLDPKLERKSGLLRLKSLHLEPGIKPTGKLVADVAAALRDFMAFHGARDLVIESSNPPQFGAKLRKALA